MTFIEYIVNEFKNWNFNIVQKFFENTQTGYFIQNKHGDVVLIYYIEQLDEWCTHGFGCFKQNVKNYNKNIPSLEEVKKEFFKKEPITLSEYISTYSSPVNMMRYRATVNQIYMQDLTEPKGNWHLLSVYDRTMPEFSKLPNTQYMYINGSFVEIK